MEIAQIVTIDDKDLLAIASKNLHNTDLFDLLIQEGSHLQVSSTKINFVLMVGEIIGIVASVAPAKTSSSSARVLAVTDFKVGNHFQEECNETAVLEAVFQHAAKLRFADVFMPLAKSVNPRINLIFSALNTRLAAAYNRAK